jgi:xanthine dehydrogenase accessory factor
MDSKLLTSLNEHRRARHPVVLVTDLNDGTAFIADGSDDLEGPLEQAVSEALRSGQSATVEVDGRTLFLNAHLPSPRICIIGAVHISQALADMAEIAGFDILIIDPRTAFASEERFAGHRLHADWPEDVLKTRPLDRHTALVAVTHDPKIDDHPLAAALAAGCFYVGALGSRKTHARRLERLGELGIDADDLARIAAPIGLDIGAATPAEIAVAILAEIISALRQKTGAKAVDA